MSSAIPKLCLTLLAAPSVEEKLLDVLLDAVGEEVFTSVPTSSHGTSHGRLSNVEQVLGRSGGCSPIRGICAANRAGGPAAER